MIDFRVIEACVDYKAYTASFGSIRDPETRRQLLERLGRLGREEPERLGVIYIRGIWGFMVIPPVGFPDFRVSFYNHTQEQTEHEILAAIDSAFEQVASVNEVKSL